MCLKENCRLHTKIIFGIFIPKIIGKCFAFWKIMIFSSPEYPDGLPVGDNFYLLEVVGGGTLVYIKWWTDQLTNQPKSK